MEWSSNRDWCSLNVRESDRFAINSDTISNVKFPVESKSELRIGMRNKGKPDFMNVPLF